MASAKSTWKGKDWYAILAPKSFNETVVGEVPATDAKLLAGRRIDVSLADLGGDPRSPSRFYLKMNKVEDKQVHTQLAGYYMAREFVSRMVRKRNDKVDFTLSATTKDGWDLHIGALLVTNRNSFNNVQTELRNMATDMISEYSKKHDLDALVMGVVEKRLQTEIRAKGNKIYPLRFVEITKIEIKKTGQNN